MVLVYKINSIEQNLCHLQTKKMDLYHLNTPLSYIKVILIVLL